MNCGRNFEREQIVKKSLLIIALLVWALSAAQAQKITAAGATFPYPIYSKWFSEYSSAHPGVQINYQSIGSGGGIKQVCSGTVDFGASDMPMPDDLLNSCGVKLTHIPTVLGADVPAYNVPGVTDLRFSPDVLADIYPGQDHQLERPTHRQGQSRRPSARPEDHRRPSFRRQRHHLHLDRLSQQGQPGVGRRSRQGHLGQLADRRRRQGQ